MTKHINAEPFFDAALHVGAIFMITGVVAGMFGISASEGFYLKQGSLVFCVGAVLLGIGGVARAVRS